MLCKTWAAMASTLWGLCLCCLRAKLAPAFEAGQPKKVWNKDPPPKTGGGGRRRGLPLSTCSSVREQLDQLRAVELDQKRDCSTQFLCCIVVSLSEIAQPLLH